MKKETFEFILVYSLLLAAQMTDLAVKLLR
jgi:hypothetical protein